MRIFIQIRCRLFCYTCKPGRAFSGKARRLGRQIFLLIALGRHKIIIEKRIIENNKCQKATFNQTSSQTYMLFLINVALFINITSKHAFDRWVWMSHRIKMTDAEYNYYNDSSFIYYSIILLTNNHKYDNICKSSIKSKFNNISSQSQSFHCRHQTHHYPPTYYRIKYCQWNLNQHQSSIV